MGRCGQRCGPRRGRPAPAPRARPIQRRQLKGPTLIFALQLYTEPRPATRGRPAAGGGSAADRLSRNRAARRAVTDLTHHNHLSTLYHMNRRIQEMYSKSGGAAGPACEQGRAQGGAL